jgi:methionine synthase I (cobalamin-dependent)
LITVRNFFEKFAGGGMSAQSFGSKLLNQFPYDQNGFNCYSGISELKTDIFHISNPHSAFLIPKSNARLSAI